MKKSKADDSTVPPVHVNLARASAVFEWAALEKIMAANEMKSEAEKRQYAIDACTLLIMGIRQDNYYKSRKGGAPSVRLFDLLRTIMCRCGLRHQFQTKFDQLIQEADKCFINQSAAYEGKKKGEKKRFHLFSHTRLKPVDLEPADAPARWKYGPIKKDSISPNALGPAAAYERAKRRKQAWELRKTNWMLVNCGSRLLDPSGSVTWRLAFWPESLMKRHEELTKLNAEQQRLRRRLNIPLDIPAIEIPFLSQ